MVRPRLVDRQLPPRACKANLHSTKKHLFQEMRVESTGKNSFGLVSRSVLLVDDGLLSTIHFRRSFAWISAMDPMDFRSNRFHIGSCRIIL
jgi:hypothetical protein